MTLLLSGRACADAILPPSSPAVQRRMLATVHAMGALIRQAGSADPKLQGCLALPFAAIVLAGTACARPLLFAECDALAHYTGHDVIVLRYDALQGATFDIKLKSEPCWLRRYLATPVDGGLRMVPDIGIGPVLRASAFGLGTEKAGAASNMPPLTAPRVASPCLVEA
jgi:hypothetical protein